MDKKQIKEIIKKEVLLKRLELSDDGLTYADIKDDVSLFESVGLDSVEVLDLILGIEQEFKVKKLFKSLPEDEVKKIVFSVNSLADFVSSKLNT